MVLREESGVEDRPGGRLTDHIGLGVLSARFHRDLLEEIINRTGCRERRRRRLPAHVMIRYVIAMGLFFDESYEEVMRRLVGSLRKMGSWVDDWQVPTAAAICQVRKRLGVAPIKELFDRAAVPVAGPGSKGAWLARRRLMAIDGTSFDVSDSDANVEHFGRMGSGPKASRFPNSWPGRCGWSNTPCPTATPTQSSSRSSPRSSTRPRCPPWTWPVSTINAGRKSPPSTRSRPTCAGGPRSYARKHPSWSNSRHGVCCWPTTPSGR